MTQPADDDAKQLAEISKELPAPDLDRATAERIAGLLRRDVGRAPSRSWIAEPVLVAIFTISFLVWTLVKVIEIFR